jgi:HNH endonuclease
VVTVDHDTLRHRVGDPVGGAGLADVDSRLSAGAVRRLACDVEVLPVVLGGRSEVLDVGRAHRLVTPPIWQALVIRDRHCAFPGCNRPPVACDAHHLRHWADGGATALDNLVLLCRAHHTTVHTTPWRVRLRRDDRRPEFVPPPGRHRDPRPVRHRPLRLRT